ncbi:MAG: hypothetical protein U9Q83_06370, partial [Bacteroidota bacterium]|nr:hypothetical protein [Bacteroidota bacterium]
MLQILILKTQKLMKKLTLFIVVVLLAGSIFAQQNQKRIALVIGNAIYEHGGDLRNPVNDAPRWCELVARTNRNVLRFAKTYISGKVFLLEFYRFINKSPLVRVYSSYQHQQTRELAN